MKFARCRVRNPALAEDAVSETMLAALESGRSFVSNAHCAAWMYAVLRHKLVDQLRRQSRETPSGDLVFDETTERTAWDGTGAWTGGADAWSDPEQACSHRQFVELVGRCCDDLPPVQRKAFVMRELLGMEAEAICRQLEVTKGHLWVLVHRARQRLRESVEQAWPLPARLIRPRAPAPSAPALRRTRNPEAEDRAIAGTLHEANVTAVLLQQPLHDEQAQPAAAWPMSLGHRQRAAEELTAQPGRNAGAGVHHRDEELSAFGTGTRADLDPDLAALRHMLDGVVQQIGEHPLDHAGIGQRIGQLARQMQQQAM
jgi:RNA polymerase sigma-70 factor (TIGR02943 family)